MRGRGERTPVMLHDGIGCDGWAWNHLLPGLAETRPVLHWHYRGHGRSGPPRDPEQIGMADVAADAVAVMRAAGVERAIHIGHSMGVQVSLEIARETPGHVAAYVLVCGAPGRVTHTFHGSDALSQVLPALIDFATRHRGVARALWGRMPPKLAFRVAAMSGEIDGLALQERDFVQYMEHLASMDPDLFLSMLERAGHHTTEDLLAGIHVPTLVVSGELDTFTPPALSAHIAEEIPGAELFVVRGATHAAPIEQPVTIALRLEKFLREHQL